MKQITLKYNLGNLGYRWNWFSGNFGLYRYNDVQNNIKLENATDISTLIITIPDYIPDDIKIIKVKLRPDRFVSLYWKLKGCDEIAQSTTEVKIKDTNGQLCIKLYPIIPIIFGTKNLLFAEIESNNSLIWKHDIYDGESNIIRNCTIDTFNSHVHWINQIPYVFESDYGRYNAKFKEVKHPGKHCYLDDEIYRIRLTTFQNYAILTETYKYIDHNCKGCTQDCEKWDCAVNSVVEHVVNIYIMKINKLARWLKEKGY